MKHLTTKNPAALTGKTGAYGAKSKAIDETLRYKEATSKKHRKQEPRRFDDTQRQVNQLKLMTSLMKQKPPAKADFNPLPTLEECNAQWNYNATTGILTMKVNRGGLKIGDVAGSKDPDKFGGYVTVYLGGKPWRAHRIIWKMVHGVDPVGCVHHRNGKRSDNRETNLEDRSILENNQRKTVARSNTGVRGVTQCSKTKLYCAEIGINDKNVKLGTYPRLNCAVEARKHAEKIVQGFPVPLVRRAA